MECMGSWRGGAIRIDPWSFLQKKKASKIISKIIQWAQRFSSSCNNLQVFRNNCWTFNTERPPTSLLPVGILNTRAEWLPFGASLKTRETHFPNISCTHPASCTRLSPHQSHSTLCFLHPKPILITNYYIYSAFNNLKTEIFQMLHFSDVSARFDWRPTVRTSIHNMKLNK